MIRFGNGSLVAFDSRFGRSKLKYPIHSLIVFNSDKKAIPQLLNPFSQNKSGIHHDLQEGLITTLYFSPSVMLPIPIPIPYSRLSESYTHGHLLCPHAYHHLSLSTPDALHAQLLVDREMSFGFKTNHPFLCVELG